MRRLLEMVELRRRDTSQYQLQLLDLRVDANVNRLAGQLREGVGNIPGVFGDDVMDGTAALDPLADALKLVAVVPALRIADQPHRTACDGHHRVA